MAAELAEDRQKFALITAKDVFALVANRIQNTGIDSDGAKMKAYTQSWAKVRKAYGLPINMRTLTFTTDMFKSIRPEVTEHNEARTVVEIKSRDAFNQKKVNGNSAIIGKSILGFSKEERQIVTEANEERIGKLRAKHLK